MIHVIDKVWQCKNLARVSDVIGSSSDTWYIVFIILIFLPEKSWYFLQPAQRSPRRHAVEPQARWLNSRGWRGWWGWWWRGRPWTRRGRSPWRPSRRAPGGRAGRRGSRTGPLSACSPPQQSWGWVSPRPSTGWRTSRIHPQTCRGLKCLWKYWLWAKTWSVASTWVRGMGGPDRKLEAIR